MPGTPHTHQLNTPGVHITEFPAFASSIVGAQTAVPIFIGYTATAVDPASGKQMTLQAVPLDSMDDYINYFGGPCEVQGAVTAGIAAVPARAAVPAGSDGKEASPAVPGTPAVQDFQARSAFLASDGRTLASAINHYLVGPAHHNAASPPGAGVLPLFNLYAAMQLFFANGGGSCFVISVDNYWGTANTTAAAGTDVTAISSEALLAGLEVAGSVSGGTMLVVPDACLLAPDISNNITSYAGYSAVVCAMMQQAATLQDRVAIIDLPGALDSGFWSNDGMSMQASCFFDAIGPAAGNFSYGASYAPALASSLLAASDIAYDKLAGTPASQTLMNNLLTSQALSLYPQHTDGSYAPGFIAIAAHIAAAFPATGTVTAFGGSTGVTGTVLSAGTPPVNLLVSVAATGICAPPADDAGRQALLQYLRKATPLLAQVLQIFADRLNVVPPSGAVAGAWVRNDASRGVWNAPANISLSQIVSPKVDVSDIQQGDFNVPLNGNAINIVRTLPGRGTVVWGARTLDGNSLDYRYIQVRRTQNYIEQSIKAALQQFAFAPNDGGTWATVTAAISNFLTQLWQAGGLMGSKASDAFTVSCGVPSTMSGQDVLNGDMIVRVAVQLVHPGELFDMTFRQAMQGN